MQHVVTVLAEAFSVADGLRVVQLPAWQDNFIWALVRDDQVWVVDGPEMAPVDALIKREGLTLRGILNTHTHPDHIGINLELERMGRLAGLEVQGPRRTQADVPGITRPLNDGDSVDLDGTVAQVWLTEGHMNGHISFIFDGAVFCGDTLFAGGCGYLFDGPPATMHASLQRLASLPRETKVCCAHEYTEDNLRFAWSVEPDNKALAERIRDVWARRKRGESTVPSTIGIEIETNPFLRTDSPQILESLRKSGYEGSTNAADIFAATRALKDNKHYKNMNESDLPI